MNFGPTVYTMDYDGGELGWRCDCPDGCYCLKVMNTILNCNHLALGYDLALEREELLIQLENHHYEEPKNKMSSIDLHIFASRIKRSFGQCDEDGNVTF